MFLFIAVSRYRLKWAKGNGMYGIVQEKPGISFEVSLPSGVTLEHLILPAKMCDSTCKVLSAREVHPSFGI